MYKADPASLCHTPCLKHPDCHTCPLFPPRTLAGCDAEIADADPDEQVLSFRFGAFVCTDISNMNSSDPGDGGDALPSWVAFFEDCTLAQDGIAFVECTPRFLFGLLAAANDHCTTHRLELRGGQICDIYDRPRCIGWSLRHDIKLHTPLEDLLMTVGRMRNPKLGLNDMFMATFAELLAGMSEWRKLRGCHREVTDILFREWKGVILQSPRACLDKFIIDHRRLVCIGKLAPNGDAICVLEQSPNSSHGRVVGCDDVC